MRGVSSEKGIGLAWTKLSCCRTSLATPCGHYNSSLIATTTSPKAAKSFDVNATCTLPAANCTHMARGSCESLCDPLDLSLTIAFMEGNQQPESAQHSRVNVDGTIKVDTGSRPASRTLNGLVVRASACQAEVVASA